MKKRPLNEDGILPLTPKELREFEDVSNKFFLERVAYSLGKIRVKGQYNNWTPISDVKTIKWVLDRFLLGE